MTKYANVYPEFLKVRSRHLAKDEQALVDFGDNKQETLKNLYESKDPRKIRYYRTH